MKTLQLMVVGAVLVELSCFVDSQAQVSSSRQLTRRIAPQLQPGQPVVPPAQPQAPSGSAVVPPRPQVAVRTQALVRIVQPPVDPVKAKAAKEEALRKTIEFQKKRAEDGSESAQYELGLRYLKGDGVDKDEAMGRRWLELSAKNGYSPATRKLDDLSKPAAAPPVRSEGVKDSTSAPKP